MQSRIKQLLKSMENYLTNDWLLDLERLVSRHSGLCCEYDINNMTFDELKGLYNWLASLE